MYAGIERISPSDPVPDHPSLVGTNGRAGDAEPGSRRHNPPLSGIRGIPMTRAKNYPGWRRELSDPRLMRPRGAAGDDGIFEVENGQGIVICLRSEQIGLRLRL